MNDDNKTPELTYQIAMDPQAGRKVLTVQTIPAWEEDDYGTGQLGRVGGFSLHGGGLGAPAFRRTVGTERA